MPYQIEPLKALAKKSLADNERLARIIYKKDKTGTKVNESMGVIVPKIHASMLNAILADAVGKEWMVSKVEEIQDKIIRGLHERGRHALFDDQIGLVALLDAIAAETATARFSKESIAAWFAADLAPLLEEAIRARLQTISSDKLEKLVAGYLRDFQLLAAREPMISQEVRTKLKKAIALLPENYESIHSGTLERILEKLETAGTAAVEDVL